MRPLSNSSLISFVQNSLSEGDMRETEAFLAFGFSRGLKGKKTKYFFYSPKCIESEVQSFSNFEEISKRAYCLCISV